MKHPLVKPPNQMSVFVQQQPANAEKQKEQHRRQTGPKRDFAAHTAPFTYCNTISFILHLQTIVIIFVINI